MTGLSLDQSRQISNGLPEEVPEAKPIVWFNPRKRSVAAALADIDLAAHDIDEAVARWARFAPLLQSLFPELQLSSGRIDSALVSVTPQTL